MPKSDVSLFQHELCTNFGMMYEMSKAEAQNFHEAFSHFHIVMTDINNETLLNALWLQENFFKMHNNLQPKEMLDLCIEYAVKRQTTIKEYQQKHKEEK